MADKLENPSDDEETESIEPESMKKESSDSQRNRDENRGNSERVAGAISRMLMAAGVLGDPLFGSAVAEHWEDDTTRFSGADDQPWHAMLLACLSLPHREAMDHPVIVRWCGSRT